MASEAQHQMAVIKWSQQPSIRSRWPELALLFHIKNETIADAKQIAIDKQQGVKKGVPDLCLPIPRGQYHSLFVEMKTDTGHTSNAQDWWITHLNAEGNCCKVCHGWMAAVDTLQWYLSLKEESKNG